MGDRVYIYDSTLRDGAQTSGIDFTSVDKQDIAVKLDEIGVDYIEGGWPGANPTDDLFFKQLPTLKHAKISAFGMTRRASKQANNDPGLTQLLDAGVGHVCMVGKSWDFHVTEALGVTLDENLAMIADSITHLANQECEVLFDAEHFFDGYKANPDYALSVIKAAYDAGARWVVLCDTNGGSMPHEVENIINEVTKHIPGDHLGIHCHNDTEQAVANSIAAVRAGVRQVQGTLNGIGERCGNTNLISLIPTLTLKMGYETGISIEKLTQLKKLSRFFDDRLNRPYHRFAPYVGESAFAHKGGLHVSAVVKNPSSYEHIEPEKVGNVRAILVSDQAGKSNILKRLSELGFDVNNYDDAKINALVAEVKKRESEGYAYDNADASFIILAQSILSAVPHYFTLRFSRVLHERVHDEAGVNLKTEATTIVDVAGEEVTKAAYGNGPVNALDNAMRQALSDTYPALKEITLLDYKVRIIDAGAATGAVTRVLIESGMPDGARWTTVGVSENIIDASYHALKDSIVFKLMDLNIKAVAS